MGHSRRSDVSRVFNQTLQIVSYSGSRPENAHKHFQEERATGLSSYALCLAEQASRLSPARKDGFSAINTDSDSLRLVERYVILLAVP